MIDISSPPRLRPVAVCAAFAFSPAAAFAEEATTRQLGDVVVSASGFEQKITDAPASISVVTAEELAKRPYTTLIDAVRDLEGVDVGETADKTGQKTISLRGMGSDYTLVLIDGKRQNNHGDIYPNSFGGNQFNHIPPLDAIERVEIIRGPASTLYGADALGGVINIITKKSAKEWTGSITHGRTHQSSNDFGNDITTDFSVRGPVIPGKLSLSLRGSVYERLASDIRLKPSVHPGTGLSTTPDVGFGGGKTVDNTNEAYGVSLYFTPDARQTVSFDYDTSKQVYDNKPTVNPTTGAVSYPLGTVDSITEVWRGARIVNGVTQSGNCINATNCTRAEPRAGYASEQEFTRESWSVSHEGKWDFGTSFAALSYVETDNNGRTLPFTVAERQELLQMLNASGPYAGMSVAQRQAAAAAAFLPRQKRTLQSNQYTLDARLDMPLKNLAGDHLLVVGGQVIDGDLDDSVFGMEVGAPGGVQPQQMWSLFVEDNWMPTTDFTLTAGLRHDKHKVFGGEMSPRLYGVYKLNPLWTVKGGVSTGFKTPKTTQLYDGIVGFGGQGTSPMFGNPDLKPETSRNTEVAVYWDHPRRHNFNATLFMNDFKDKISSQPCGGPGDPACNSTGDYAGLGYANSSKTVNIDEAEIKGLELAGRWQIMDAWALRGNYTYTDSEQKSGSQKGRPLMQSAKHMFNATLDWQALPNLDVFLTLESRSKRYRGSVDANGNLLYFKDYDVLHLGASLKVNKHITINGRINNLLDKDFTGYTWAPCTGSGCTNGYSAQYDYNNKDKGRNLWVSVNAAF